MILSRKKLLKSKTPSNLMKSRRKTKSKYKKMPLPINQMIDRKNQRFLIQHSNLKRMSTQSIHKPNKQKSHPKKNNLILMQISLEKSKKLRTKTTHKWKVVLIAMMMRTNGYNRVKKIILRIRQQWIRHYRLK